MVESYVAFKNAVNQSIGINAGKQQDIDALAVKLNAMKRCIEWCRTQ
ncbi:hypothetical protein [Nonomuraea montanisoli]|nr:hypothetical protein [Nonomuraea montanisoli]